MQSEIFKFLYINFKYLLSAINSLKINWALVCKIAGLFLKPKVYSLKPIVYNI